MGSIVKGMGSSWMSGGEQLEQLKVVRVEERDVAVDPPAVPPGLVAFLEERKTRRDREVRTREPRHGVVGGNGVGPYMLCTSFLWESCTTYVLLCICTSGKVVGLIDRIKPWMFIFASCMFAVGSCLALLIFSPAACLESGRRLSFRYLRAPTFGHPAPASIDVSSPYIVMALPSRFLSTLRFSTSILRPPPAFEHQTPLGVSVLPPPCLTSLPTLSPPPPGYS